MQFQITDMQSASKALEMVTVGSKIRITFKISAGGKLQSLLLRLRHKLEFDTMWLAVVNNTVALSGEWEGVPRTQDFTILQMSGADREVFAHTFAEIAESIDLL